MVYIHPMRRGVNKMSNIITQYWGKEIFIPSLKGFNGIVRFKVKDKDGGIKYINVGSVASGTLKIQLPNEHELSPCFGKHYLSPKNDVIQKYIVIYFLDIFENDSNTRFDQIQCFFHTNENEDSLWFRYSDKKINVLSEHTETTLDRGAEYVEKQTENFNLHPGWNVIWTHKECSDNGHILLLEHRTDLKDMPNNIMWKCLNH
jgi:hypothetical protein